MIRKSDVQWWILEASKDPESAPRIIEELAQRLAELDAENERLRGEVVRLQGRSPAASSQVSALQHQVDTLQGLLKDQGSAETALVFVSDSSGAARMPLSQVRLHLRKGRPALVRSAALEVRCLLPVRPPENLLLITGRGRLVQASWQDIPLLPDGGDWPAGEGLPPAESERVTAAAVVSRPPRFWTIVSRRGYVRQLLRAQVHRARDPDEPLFTSPLHNDEPIAILDGDRGDLLLITGWGKAVRFPQRAIPGGGSIALKLDQDDQVVTALPLPSDTEVLVLTAAGFALRRDTARFEARARPGGRGRAFIQAFDVLGAFPHATPGQVVYLTYSGQLISADAAKIPLERRVGKGVQVHDLSQDPAVAVTLVPGALL